MLGRLIALMKKPEVSVVIVNYNGKHLLKDALDSVRNLKFKGIFGTMVVDNNSSDGSADFIKKNYKGVRVVKNPFNLGYSGINSALRCCKGSFILFLNNDIKIDKLCLEKLYAAIKDVNVAMAVPRLINYYDSNLKSCGTWVSRSFYCGHIGSSQLIKEVPYLGVGLVRKEIADKFGYLFDSDYFIYGEDLDLGMRIRLLGMKTILVEDAVLLHMHSATMQKVTTARKVFLMERNLLITFFKTLSFKNIILFLPYAVAVRLFASAKDIVSLRFSSGFARIKAILWIISNFKIVASKRNQTQILRKAPDRFILKIFSEKNLFRKKFIV